MDCTETEKFFAAFDGVIEARVWTSGTALLARLIVDAHSHVSGNDLKQACAKKLGTALTPQLLMIERIQPKPIALCA